MTGSLLGTPSYMSPEQAKGAAIDGRSDLFSVGCVLYEMIAGKKAFRGDSITGLIFKIITEEPPALREMDPDVPEEMIRIIARALAKTPDARYQSGRELADDLLALTRAGTTPTLRESERPTAAGLAVGTSATVITPATMKTPADAAPTRIAARPAATPPPPPPPLPPPAPARDAAARPSPPPAAAPPERRSGAGLMIALGALALVLFVAAAGGGWYFFLRKTDPGATAALGSPAPTSETEGARTAGTPVEQPAPSLSATTAPIPATVPPAAPANAPLTTMPAGNPGSGRVASNAGTAAVPTQPRTGGNTAPPPPPVDARPASDYGYLDEVPPADDGREAGEQLAGTYRNQQGGNTGSTGFGSSRRFNVRERTPRQLARPEVPAVATMRHVMDRMEAFQRQKGRYPSLDEVKAAGLALDVPTSGASFQRRGYRFDVTTDSDGFRITATPLSPAGRTFVGDDSGYIRAGVE